MRRKKTAKIKKETEEEKTGREFKHIILGWPKGSFGFFHKMLCKNWNELGPTQY